MLKTTINASTVTPLLEQVFKNNERKFIVEKTWSNNGNTFGIKEGHNYIPTITLNGIEHIIVINSPENFKPLSHIVPVLCTEKQIKLWVNGGILPVKKSTDEKNSRRNRSITARRMWK